VTSCGRYCEALHPQVWTTCADEFIDEFSGVLEELGCINHTMTRISPRLMLPHNASVLEVANA
jgi:hypothetical protein